METSPVYFSSAAAASAAAASAAAAFGSCALHSDAPALAVSKAKKQSHV
jgi:hypothetical protein